MIQITLELNSGLYHFGELFIHHILMEFSKFYMHIIKNGLKIILPIIYKTLCKYRFTQF